jgi:hypothetical protein
VSSRAGRILTYCTNIHPGEAWAEVLANLDSHLLAVKHRFSPGDPFAIGLRLSNQAALDLGGGEAKRFRNWCEKHGCFVPTINGFPYGRFHGRGVKERVYLPDWRDPERARYTERLADLLAGWLPPGLPGSISSVPLAFARGFETDAWKPVRRNLIAALEHLRHLREQSGAEIVLALEPEPGCVIETTSGAVACFERLDLPASLAPFCGVCLDCCHQAVEFEEPERCLRVLRGAGIRIAKVQVSSALRALGAEVAGLARFDEPIYLHQVVARTPEGQLHRWDDLPGFLADRPGSYEECRVHFHVPVFAERLEECGTTRSFLEAILPELDPSLLLEVETYSWDVLPRALRLASVTESIVRELEWVKDRIDEKDRRS